MKELQSKMLRVLDEEQTDLSTWRGQSVWHLRTLLVKHADLDPPALKKALNAGYPFNYKKGAAYKAWRKVKAMAYDEATGLGRLKRNREFEAQAAAGQLLFSVGGAKA